MSEIDTNSNAPSSSGDGDDEDEVAGVMEVAKQDVG